MPSRSNKPTHRLTRLSLLTALSLILFTVEAQLPSPVPIPGIKLGLANIVTVYAMFAYGPRDCLLILLVRIFLGSVFAGAMMTFLYALGGGMLSYLSMCILRHFLTERQIWVASVLSGMCHNTGQTLVAIAIFQSLSVAFYFPVLLLSGLITGLLTGLVAQYLLQRIPPVK